MSSHLIHFIIIVIILYIFLVHLLCYRKRRGERCICVQKLNSKKKRNVRKKEEYFSSISTLIEITGNVM